MPDDFQAFYETPYTPAKDMSRSEVEDELQKWRNLWTWVEADVQWWLTHVGRPCRVVRRDYHSIVGTFGQPHFKLAEIEVNTLEREYNYVKGIATYETKTVVIGLGAIVDYELIEGSESVYEDISGNVVEPKEDLIEEPV